MVLAVPKGWADAAIRCNQPSRDTVYFAASTTTPALCRPAFRRVSSLAISDHTFETKAIAFGAADGDVAGHDVRTTHGCLHAIDGPCFANISVPDLGAFFQVTIHGRDPEERVQQMRDSLTVLPDGLVTVPIVSSWHRSDVEDAYAEMEALGLEPTIEDGCPAGLCDISAWTEPPSGRVVAAGTPVTIYVVGWGDGPDPYPLNVLTCESDYQRADGVYDVIPPSSPQEAREQGWPTDPLAAVEGVPDAPLWRHLEIVDLTLLDSFDDGLTRVSAQDAEGRTVLIMRVEELVKGAWAMTGSETCG